jgi:glycine/D-amino acid oxidase-like deaminating enzyme/nitrite reductase/ring-hydroxylating ferredoxin subunit
MKSDSGTTTSVWMATAEVTGEPALNQNLTADVCIVGAGMAGLTTAYLLQKAGQSVVVIDDGPITGGETCRTTAHLSNAFDDRYYEVERLHGLRASQLTAESHTAAIDQIEKIAASEQIDCDFVRLNGYLFIPPGGDLKELEQELEASHRAGLNDVALIDRSPLPFFDTGPCLRFPRQGQFHPLKYLEGLASIIVQRGGKIFTHTHAQKIEGGRIAIIEAENGYKVEANAVVVATNTPVNDRVAIHTKQAPYRTYVIGVQVPHGSVPLGLYWDTPDPYHYVRLQQFSLQSGKPDGEFDILIVGGEDHKTGQLSNQNIPFGRLETWTRERFPMALKIAFRWSGQVMEPTDYLAFIGRNPMDANNVYIATGDSGQGMTHGTIAGILLTDLILGLRNDWADLYNPSRISMRVATDFAKENLNVAAQYTELLSSGEVHSAEEISPGEGAIIRHGLTKVAVHRDLDGTLHERSAICRHLGCVVHWNSVEKTWDCPCHGSRYACDGHVINGPANSGLKLKSTEEVYHNKAA